MCGQSVAEREETAGLYCELPQAIANLSPTVTENVAARYKKLAKF